MLSDREREERQAIPIMSTRRDALYGRANSMGGESVATAFYSFLLSSWSEAEASSCFLASAHPIS
jgi:hypothetical protein